MRRWVLDCYRAYAKCCLCAALILTPLATSRAASDEYGVVKITVLWVFGIAGIAFLVCWTAERGIPLPKTRIGWSALAFLVAGSVSTILSPSPALSLIGHYGRFGGLIPFALYAGMMVLVIGLYWERPDDLRSLPRSITGAAVFVALLIFLQAIRVDATWVGGAFPGGGRVRFPPGPLGNSNFSGAYLAIALPFVLYLTLTTRDQLAKVFLFFAVAIVLGALWLTQTRGGMVALVAGMAAMALSAGHQLTARVKAGLLIGAVAISAVLVVAVWHPGMQGPPPVLARAHAFETDTLENRAHYWTAAWRAFLAHPVVGTGLDTLHLQYPRFKVAADDNFTGTTLTDKPHNIYLERAADTGILGGASFLVLIGLGVLYGYRGSQRLEGPSQLLLAAFLGSFVAYLAQGFFSIDEPALAMMGWVALGAIAALADPRALAARSRLEILRGEKRRPYRRKRGKRGGQDRRPALPAEWHVARNAPLRLPVHVGVGLATLGLLAVGVRPLAADINLNSGQFEEAIKLQPFEAIYRAAAAQGAEREARASYTTVEKRMLLQRALARYEEALDLWPGSVAVMMSIANVHTTWAKAIDSSRFPEADRWWAKVVAAAPSDKESHRRYSLMLSEWSKESTDPTIEQRAARESQLSQNGM